SVPFSSQNVFKMNLSSKQVTLLGTAKVTNGAAFNSIFVGQNKRIYAPEFASGYKMVSYDENLADRKILIEGMVGALPEEVIPMGPNILRLVRGRGLDE